MIIGIIIGIILVAIAVGLGNLIFWCMLNFLFGMAVSYMTSLWMYLLSNTICFIIGAFMRELFKSRK